MSAVTNCSFCKADLRKPVSGVRTGVNSTAGGAQRAAGVPGRSQRERDRDAGPLVSSPDSSSLLLEIFLGLCTAEFTLLTPRFCSEFC